jgi:phosphoribosylformylglycinamidine synthase
MALASSVGIELESPLDLVHAGLFAEDQGRYLVATSDPIALAAAADAAGVPRFLIGAAEGDAIVVEGLCRLPLERLRTAHEGWLPGYMGV